MFLQDNLNAILYIDANFVTTGTGNLPLHYYTQAIHLSDQGIIIIAIVGDKE